MDEISEFLKSMRKAYGDNAVFTLDQTVIEDVEVIPTGSLALDVALGVGGIPRGRLTELYGSDGSGKTTVCFHIIAEAQRMGHDVLFVDVENAVDISYAKKLGVNIDTVYWSQPQSMEEALTIIEGGISAKFPLVVLDSVAALAPVKEQEDDLESANVALTPRALSKFFRRNGHVIRENEVSLLFTNQVRDNIGSYFGGLVTPGGHSLKHFRSVALSLRRSVDIKAGGETVGHTAVVVVKKNKVASPFKQAEFDIIYGIGIDPYRDTIEVAKSLGIVTLKGSWYTYKGENLGQGKDNAAKELENNEELYMEIRKECLDGTSAN